MSARLLKAYRPDGSTRAVWQDTIGPGLRRAGVMPRRASRVEVIPDGPSRGRFHVDLTLLSEIAGNPKLAVCLTQTFDSYSEAVAAEVRFIEHNWVLEGVRGQDAERLVRGAGEAALREGADESGRVGG